MTDLEKNLPDLMESWRKVWREGVAPQLSTRGLEALLKGLQEDDLRLIQGTTTTPPPLQSILDWSCEGACLIGYADWQGYELENIGDIEEFFARVCYEAEKTLGELGAIRYLLNWYDDAPRDEMRKLLIPEVTRELENRKVLQGGLDGKANFTSEDEHSISESTRVSGYFDF